MSWYEEEWPNGFEAWCGIYGRYVSLVREESAISVWPYVTIASMGIIADRDETLWVSSLTVSYGNSPISVNLGEQLTLTVDFETNDPDLEPYLQLRQSPETELDFVTITNDAPNPPTVTISPEYRRSRRSMQSLATYDLGLEMVAVYPSDHTEIMQTSTVNFEVVEPSVYTDQTPETVQLTAGSDYSWTLPINETAVDRIEDINVDFGDAIEFLSFDEDKFEFNVEGMVLTNDFAGSYLIVITLQTESGTDHVLYFGVFVTAQTSEAPDPDPSQEEGEEAE